MRRSFARTSLTSLVMSALLAPTSCARIRATRLGGPVQLSSSSPGKPSTLLPSTAFTILEVSTSAQDKQVSSLHIIGPRKVRRTAVPNEDSLQRQLKAAQSRHRKLAKSIGALDAPRTRAWNAQEIRALKRSKVRTRDHIEHLEATLRRLRDAQCWQLGNGAFGRILLGQQSTGDLVAIKLVPLAAKDSAAKDGGANLGAMSDDEVVELHTEAEVLSLMTSRNEPGFPRLLHCAKQLVLGQQSMVLVMELLGPKYVGASCIRTRACPLTDATRAHRGLQRRGPLVGDNGGHADVGAGGTASRSAHA